MKIIISPSKAQAFSLEREQVNEELIFSKETKSLVNKIKRMNKREMSSAFKVSGSLLDKTYQDYKKFDVHFSTPAIDAYQGLVFKQLTIDENALEYLSEHLIILSALYGALNPLDLIKPYRLDMKVKLYDNQSLKEFWKSKLSSLFEDNEVIINLASDEFSQVIEKEMINIIFKEESEDKDYKISGTYSKMARGKMLQYLMENKIEEIHLIKEFKKDGYQYNNELSDINHIVFTR